MQAVYSTTTDVKIHQAIRREWASFQAWLSEQHRRLTYREDEILAVAQRRRGKMKEEDVRRQLDALQDEFLAVARGEWLARVRHSQLHLEHWVMTPDEKQVLQMTLGWTQKDMVDAYSRQQAAMGSMYQRVDPITLGTKEPPMPSTSRFMHPPVNTNVPAYTKWASELPKTPPPPPAPSAKAPKSKSGKSVDLPGLPLYFVGALLQGTDVDAVVAAELEAFALRVSEEKIREYYTEACASTLNFQRHLATLDPSQREAGQERFEQHMRDLAGAKEREWKALTVKELRRHETAEKERRVAQQRAMRPSPPRRHRHPVPEFQDWEYVDDYNGYTSPPQDYYDDYGRPQADYFQEWRSPQEHRSPHAYRSPRREYRETFQSPILSSVETYRSPRRPRRRVVNVADEEHAVSPPVDDFHRLRRRNASYREGGYGLSPPPSGFGPLPPNPQQPRQTGLLSGLTRWISSLGRRDTAHERATISSFDWREPQYIPPPEGSSRSGRAKTAKEEKRSTRQAQYEDYGWADRDEYSEEEFPIRKSRSRWREMLSLGRRKGRRQNPSPTPTDIGWMDPDYSDY